MSHGPAWRPKEKDKQYDKFETTDGTEYILHVPNFNQSVANRKSSIEYKDVFDQIKAKVKDDDAIEKNEAGLPILDHIAWAALLSYTLKELNKTWGVNDKIWIYNKRYDGTKSTAMYVAITPKITQSNAKRKARKVSAAATAATDDDDIVFGTELLPPITQEFYVRTRFNGNKYYYLNKEDADEGNSNYDHVEEYVSEDEESIASADEEDEDEDVRKAGGTRGGEKPTMGGKSTKKRLTRKSTSKKLKKKRTATRRKMTTTRRK
jgi:hypothetical protein